MSEESRRKWIYENVLRRACVLLCPCCGGQVVLGVSGLFDDEPLRNIGEIAGVGHIKLTPIEEVQEGMVSGKYHPLEPTRRGEE